MIDWSLAKQIAGAVAGNPSSPRLRAFDELPAVAAESEQLVSGYTGLRASAPLPRAEALGRAEWIDANIVGLRAMLEPLVGRVGEGFGPLAPALRAGAGLLLAAEIGVLFGYLGRNVLGQYELVILDPESPARLLFVAPNLDEAVRAFGADADELLAWVALHEVTHALQFAGVPWLQAHLAQLLRELMAKLEVRVDAARALRLPSTEDLRVFVDAVRSGNFLTFVAGREQRALLDQVQAVMAVIEGYAEHVMDAVGADLLPSLPRLRSALEHRRASRSRSARLLARIFGLDLKLRQYETGKRFCDAVAEEGGVDALNRVWRAPEALPSLRELEDPSAWVRRTSVPIVTK
ncbi:MAG: hypothetical protein QOD76_286 [Solirubrobacteraceae bacterium]|nr:hypothetical protein [Solirubrobacteraceae bacterium]